ncbi:MAG: LapA family protein [Pseudomonadota bacterium]
MAAVAIFLIVTAMANRGTVDLRLLPPEMGEFFGLTDTVTMPLFLVIYGGIVVGILIGYCFEWLREMKYRTKADQADREISKLEREVTRLKGAGNDKKDDVLALLE